MKATTRRRSAAENRTDGTRRLAQWLQGRGAVTDGEALVESLLKLGGRPLVDHVAAEAGIDQQGGLLDLIGKLDERLREPLAVD